MFAFDVVSAVVTMLTFIAGGIWLAKLLEESARK
jgi:hypothetical protein